MSEVQVMLVQVWSVIGLRYQSMSPINILSFVSFSLLLIVKLLCAIDQQRLHNGDTNWAPTKSHCQCRKSMKS